MNIFFLCNVTEYLRMAMMYVDGHVSKIATEITQMLFCAWYIHDGEVHKEVADQLPKVYGKTHIGHPMVKWVAAKRSHYYHAVRIGLALCHVKKMRYPDRPEHQCKAILRVFAREYPRNMPGFPCDPYDYPPQCVPEHFKQKDPSDYVKAYRDYYTQNKMFTLSYSKFRYALEHHVPDFVSCAFQQAKDNKDERIDKKRKLYVERKATIRYYGKKRKIENVKKR